MAKDDDGRSASKRSGERSGKRSGKGAWRLLDTGAKLATAVVAGRVSALVWRAATGKQPPTATQHPELRTVEALTWAALAGATVELSKVLINRRAVQYWVDSTGHLPPGMKPIGSMSAEDFAKARAKDAADVKRRLRKR